MFKKLEGTIKSIKKELPFVLNTSDDIQIFKAHLLGEFDENSIEFAQAVEAEVEKAIRNNNKIFEQRVEVYLVGRKRQGYQKALTMKKVLKKENKKFLEVKLVANVLSDDAKKRLIKLAEHPDFNMNFNFGEKFNQILDREDELIEKVKEVASVVSMPKFKKKEKAPKIRKSTADYVSAASQKMKAKIEEGVEALYLEVLMALQEGRNDLLSKEKLGYVEKHIHGFKCEVCLLEKDVVITAENGEVVFEGGEISDNFSKINALYLELVMNGYVKL